MKRKQILVVGAALLNALLMPAVAGATPQQSGLADPSSSAWAGMHVHMQMTGQGATFEFDCAHGATLQPITPDAKGDFSVAGTYTPERPGPVQRDSTSQDLPATYKGTITGDTMHLEVVLAAKDQAPPPLTLTRGGSGKLVRCR